MTDAKCPICGKPPLAAHRPFCSTRCADVDLHRWLTGAYSIGGTPKDGQDQSVVPYDEGEPSST